jgi:catechol 2,3-dioxygenase-like lactoylglutathione lyase family enzyme
MSSNPTSLRYSLEVVTLPVSDVDRALAFYTNGLGFALDVDYGPDAAFRVVQVTPPGSATSIQFGVGLTPAAPGSGQGGYLVVTDIVETHRQLTARGVPVEPLRHKAPVDDWRGGFDAGPDPDRRDYATFADLTDPDGNTWVLQERGHHTTD